LVDNALRYAGAEKPVEVDMRSDDKEFTIDVRDQGPGVPADEVERIKRPFARLESARSNTAGAGLGLAIVERVARGHGGRLELFPREGGGLVARLILSTTGPIHIDPKP
jgi:two-component system osmolarity sensor histidine kinase EnvZ